MTVDLSKIKPGDEVLIRCVVLNPVADGDGDWVGNLGAGSAGDPCRSHFKPDRIVSHTHALAVGDRVKVKGFQPATVIGVDGSAVWMKTDGDSRWWLDASQHEWERV